MNQAAESLIASRIMAYKTPWYVALLGIIFYKWRREHDWLARERIELEVRKQVSEIAHEL